MASTPRTPEEFTPEEEPVSDGLSEVDYPEESTTPVNHPTEPVDSSKQVTRAGMVWTATVAGLLMLVLLIIFIVQNQDQVTLRYFGLSGQVSLGLALFIAAVGGGILAAIAGAVRIIQLRTMARKSRKNSH
ncbi:lipopolysaccharide assembly protein LapA domain-containing protein [Glutamicibacter sp. MNS18]|uniref:LapA family protein n=1 Tax=Glutamicibacter sp. MNS18 TaxID=2989817 RepID=UPI002236850B|nr:lipopolysaccharide assembly protein LapA domain-containing protein [Glutamicibacter sp. MNS18]MCW4466596.1 lipopolysaccharide assembly protein LapA domain-containing protein [Glutamicibacter sp. MNS18]